MAGAYRTKAAKKRGRDGKWTCWWMDAAGKKRTCPGTTNEKESKEIARALEHEQLLIKKGLVDPADRHRRESGRRPVLEHLEDYRAHLEAKGDTRMHVTNTESAIRRLFDLAGVEYVGDITPDRIQGALARVKSRGFDGKGSRSARTCNHALTAVKGFSRWLADTGRLKDFPAGLRALEPFPARSDRRRVRRPLTLEELARLLEATERGPEFVASREKASRWSAISRTLDGPTRAMAYRVAMATGFRAQEIRTLTPERFRLEGDNPTVTVLACYSKRGKGSGRDDVQPVDRRIAAEIRPWLEGRPPGVPLFPFPADRTAKILAADLDRAGIAAVDSSNRVVDFHSLRHSYVTHLVNAGVNPKVIQKLARHSSITLTLDTYTTLEDSEIRAALEGADTTYAPREESR